MIVRSFNMFRAHLLAAALAGCIGVPAYSQQNAPASVPKTLQGRNVPPDVLQKKIEWMTTLSNWGRWGKDDQMGALNLITQAKRVQALSLAKLGIVVSLEKPIAIVPEPDESKADGLPHGIPFYQITFNTFGSDDPRHNGGFSSDLQMFHVHGNGTHVDALCHDSYEGKLYNGYSLTETVDHVKGCTKDGMQTMQGGIVTRGVLIDLPRLKGLTPPLPQSMRLLPADLDAWEKQTGIKVSAGDAIFLYTGRKGDERYGQPNAGGGNYDVTVMPWLRARDVALISSDAGNADHQLSLPIMGVPLLDDSNLGELARTAARLNRWEFLLVVAPAAPFGATGAMVNPLAIF